MPMTDIKEQEQRSKRMAIKSRKKVQKTDDIVIATISRSFSFNRPTCLYTLNKIVPVCV